MLPAQYDVILVGTGFASSMFLQRLVKKRKNQRILVLERGPRRDHRWQLTHRGELGKLAGQSFINAHPKKAWVFTLAFGGGSNCWWACTPRMFPDDFELKTRYGIGEDWPISYDDLEPYYTEVEQVMGVSGPMDSPFPRSAPYPLPPHRFTGPEKLLKKAHPNAFFSQPTARPTKAVGNRPGCCNSGVCTLCPIDSKFTILNSMAELYQGNHIELKTDANVERVDLQNGVATGVQYRYEEGEHVAKADLIVLGANGIFNPHILLRSGVQQAQLGKGLVEQASVDIKVYLDGLDNFDGSTSITGHGYNYYSGAHRKDHAAMMIETWNVPELRMQRGKWRQIMKLKFIVEDLRQSNNTVAVDPSSSKAVADFKGISKYTMKALNTISGKLSDFLKGLPVEHVDIGNLNSTEAHVIGTTVMGVDPESSVVDAGLVHHQVRNLVVLGSGVFPTAAPANPTLTLSALSLRAADQLLS